MPLWEMLTEETAVKTLAARSAKPILQFVEMMRHWQGQVETQSAANIIQGILEDSGYVRDLKNQGTDEADDRIGNVQELQNAALQYAEENTDESLPSFLANTALASDLDDLDEKLRCH